MILGYVRASDDSCSIESQWDIIEGYARSCGIDKYGVQIFTDIGNSGAARLAFRPGGSELLETMKAGDIVVTSRFDRMFRSSKDAIHVLEEFRVRGVYLIIFDISSQSVFESMTYKCLVTILKAIDGMEQVVFKERMTKARKRVKESKVSIVTP